MSGSGPIYEYQREVTARLEQALRERDEVRANYAHDRAEWDKAAERMETLMRGLVKSRDEARAEVTRVAEAAADSLAHANRTAASLGFRRGAEAMREAAIRVCEEPQMGTEADAIRALPVPEDKP